jgi:cytochrome d ubiquinol oxidase subunit I
MSDLLAARLQMAISLGFHIVFAEIGIAMPLLMVLAEWRWQKTGDEAWRLLARRWARGTAVLFAVGAVSGTVLSFELGLLWPRFMQFAGPVIGIPFSLEGFAFFTEAIFLGIYLYGWEKVSPRAHLLSGIVVAISGAASAVFVVMVNAWMNTPTGLQISNGSIVAVDPIAGMMNPSSLQQAIHMLLAAYASTGLAVAGIHAYVITSRAAAGRLPQRGVSDRGNLSSHRYALVIALCVGAPAAILQPISGDLSARVIAHYQPRKLAAAESHFETMRGAPLTIGGIPDVTNARTSFAIQIPKGLSLLAFHDPNAEVKGLLEYPRDLWPPVAPVHFGFQLMVGLGTAMAAVSVWALVTLVRRKTIGASKWLLRAIIVVAPFGFIATEAGWTVTEVGRQPWVVSDLVRTADAVTPMHGLVYPMTLFTLLYIGLAIVVVAVMRSLVKETT